MSSTRSISLMLATSFLKFEAQQIDAALFQYPPADTSIPLKTSAMFARLLTILAMSTEIVIILLVNEVFTMSAFRSHLEESPADRNSHRPAGRERRNVVATRGVRPGRRPEEAHVAEGHPTRSRTRNIR